MNKIAISMQEESADGNEHKNLKVDRFKQQVVEICELLVKEKEKFVSNRVSTMDLIKTCREYNHNTRRRLSRLL